MKKYRFLSLFLAVVTLFSVTVTGASATGAKLIKDGDFQYRLLDNGTLRVNRYLSNKDKNTAVDITIPSEVSGYKVTEIGKMSGIRKVNTFTVPDTVVTMENALRNTETKTLVLGKNLKHFNRRNLDYVYGEVICNSKYFKVKKGILYNANMTKLIYYPKKLPAKKFKVPDSVKTIGFEAFANYDLYSDEDSGALREVDLNNVTTVKTGAFQRSCVTKINITSKTKTICDYGFDPCRLKKITIASNKDLKIGKGAFRNAAISSIQLTGTIGEQSFGYCENLSKVTFDKTVKAIGKDAFINCSKLKSVTIPKTVTKIGKHAFGYVTDDDPNDPFSFIYVKINGFTVKGAKGSAAEKYAKANGFTFKAIKK